ncbi:hypothetical protein ANO11243_057680 [Dothideomycetidae sp. 11243]|nr:hypothetical protein ANO11243_057680 [fungal sp. No.11243]
MSAAPAPTGPKDAANPAVSKPTSTTTTTALEEDDEFEDFPVEDWPAENDMSASYPSDSSTSTTTTTTAGQQGQGQGQTGQNNGPAAHHHLWEESWDDDDVATAGEDFAAQLKAEMGK